MGIWTFNLFVIPTLTMIRGFLNGEFHKKGEFLYYRDETEKAWHCHILHNDEKSLVFLR